GAMRRPRTAARTGRRAAAGRLHGTPDRWCRCRRRTRCQARHRSGRPLGGGHLTTRERVEVMTNKQPQVAASLAGWHRMVAAGDLTGLSELLHPDAVFRSPMAFSPYESAAAVMLILNTVLQVFENFAYHRQLTTEDGLSVVLEF